MTDFTIKITDRSLLAGITYARENYNSNLNENETQLTTNEEYLQWLIERAAESYSSERREALITHANENQTIFEAIVAAEEGDLTLLDELRARYVEKIENETKEEEPEEPEPSEPPEPPPSEIRG